MNSAVLDSSAILAILLQEDDNETAITFLDNAKVSSVNVAEIFSKLAEKNMLTEEVVSDFQHLGLEIIDFDLEQAQKTAELRPLTRHLGLSLGARCCLALAILHNSTAVTADRNWKETLFCKIEVIR
jgi:PIN domain nuclease of toxin-antitoxin system